MSGKKTPPPKFYTPYAEWRDELLMWKLLKYYDNKEQGLVVCLQALQDNLQAKQAVSRLSATQLNAEDGLDKLLECLDDAFKEEKHDEEHHNYQKFTKFRKKPNQTIKDYILEFEHLYYKMSGSNDQMKMADSLLAFVLLDNSGINDEGKKLAFTYLNTQGITFKNMKSALIRVFSSDSGHGLDAFTDCKMEIKQEALYTKRKSSSGFSKFNSKYKTGSSSSFIKYNPKNQYGQITRCSCCDSTMHYKKECQHRHLFRHLEDVNINESCSDEESSEESVNIVLMAQEVSTSEVFVTETYKCAVVDTACSKTVGGTKWIESFVDNLPESKRNKVLCESSKTTFKFGDGRKVKSHCIVRIPVQIGDVHCSIDAEVVDEEIPLLMSKSSLKKAINYY